MLASSDIIYTAVEPWPVRSADWQDISSHEEWFKHYAAAETELCKRDTGPLQLKTAHTFKVLANAREIARGEGFGPAPTRACLLAALYHDLGRFEQYRVWGTFRDALSCSHGELSEHLLQKMDVLRNEPFLARQVQQACGLHSAFVLPEALPADVRLVTNTVRDADKLDIMRVMAHHLAHKPYSPTVVLSRPDDPTLCSEKVISSALSCTTASYEDLTSVNDFRILLGTWIFGLNFATSRRRLAADGHLQTLLAAIPEGPHAAARDFLLEKLTTL